MPNTPNEARSTIILPFIQTDTDSQVNILVELLDVVIQWLCRWTANEYDDNFGYHSISQKMLQQQLQAAA